MYFICFVYKLSNVTITSVKNALYLSFFLFLGFKSLLLIRRGEMSVMIFLKLLLFLHVVLSVVCVELTPNKLHFTLFHYLTLRFSTFIKLQPRK